MPKLKGLLDTARTKLTGLLGDFPQGFNAGAVAGFPGWAGDMAYMADTARLALTGADQQAAPENYIGTTEYIAKQAGYPVPQTLSGQLGAAVGGLMSPGPGDLAKFAPVLSAIPFWHGSPHKYDAVDLSKIGTGEGAQAYGWGYYGADARGTAEDYKRTLGGDALVTQDGRQITPKQGTVADVALAHLASVPEDSSNPFLLAERSVREAQKVATDANKPFFDKVVNALATLEGKGVKAGDGGNLYKGEYRWPDPAKEAATPLTGEDLLDWDRPLSEQSEIIRIIGKDAGLPDAATGKDLYTALQMNGRDGAIARGDNAAATMERSQAAASKDLADFGIPGIRYLDGMSRDGGKGTYNYVMFDDKGIKLLERNGSPIEDFAARRAGKAKPYRELAMDEASRMQRANEMGFDTPAVHWSRHGVDVNELDSGKFAIAPFDAIGTHTGTPEAAMKRFEGWASPERGAGVTYPVLIKNKKPYLDPEGKPWNEQKLTEHLREIGGYDTERADYKTLNAKLREKIFSEYDSIPYINDVEDAGSVSYITPPQNIRSRWAAFDPKNKDSANLLAGTAAAAVGLGAYKQQEEQRRRRVD